MTYPTMEAAQLARRALATKLDALVVIRPADGGYVLAVA